MSDDDIEALRAQLAAARKQSGLALVARGAASARRLQELAASEEAYADAHLGRVAAEREASVAQAALDRQRGEHADQLALTAVTAASRAAAHVVAAEKAKAAPLLSACFKAYCRERAAGKAWTSKTFERQEFTFRCLVEGLGDRPINAIRREEITAFFERLQRLPANAQKMPGLKGKGFLELTDITGYPPISDQTVNDHMTRVSSFFKWAKRIEDYGLSRNPAEAFSIRHIGSKKRQPFTPSQLLALFSDQSWQRREFAHPHYYWLMPIAALTGMRINEICQLKLSDFITVEGTHVIRCAHLEPGSRRKGENATRRVPVHGELLRLGLIRWVDGLRKHGQTQLFPELKEGRDGHGQAASKWFRRYRHACGIEGNQVHVFHSFRHYFICERMDRDVVPHKIAAVAGHETGLITGDIYWSDRDVHRLLADVVDVTGLPDAVVALIPTIEEVNFKKVPRRPPSRLGARKSRAKRIADAAARRASKSP